MLAEAKREAERIVKEARDEQTRLISNPGDHQAGRTPGRRDRRGRSRPRARDPSRRRGRRRRHPQHPRGQPLEVHRGRPARPRPAPGSRRSRSRLALARPPGLGSPHVGRGPRPAVAAALAVRACRAPSPPAGAGLVGPERADRVREWGSAGDAAMSSDLSPAGSQQQRWRRHAQRSDHAGGGPVPPSDLVARPYEDRVRERNGGAASRSSCRTSLRAPGRCCLTDAPGTIPARTGPPGRPMASRPRLGAPAHRRGAAIETSA